MTMMWPAHEHPLPFGRSEVRPTERVRRSGAAASGSYGSNEGATTEPLQHRERSRHSASRRGNAAHLVSGAGRHQFRATCGIAEMIRRYWSHWTLAVASVFWVVMLVIQTPH